MGAKTDPINTLNPPGDSDPKQGDDHIRTLAKALIELLTVDHYVGVANPWGSDASGDETGEHAKVMFHEVLSSDPDPGSGKMAAYIKTVGGRTEFVVQNEDDNVIDMTSGDYLKHTSLSNYAYTPVGMVTPYGGSSAPSGWLLCNDQAVSRTDYAALFSIIGTSYGIGDGSTTFNVPDLRGRVPVGLDASDVNLAAADALGETGGEELHTLTTDEMPAHVHNIDTKQDSHGSPKDKLSPGNNDLETDSFNTDSTGGGSAHNNLQPYQVLNYIIKT